MYVFSFICIHIYLYTYITTELTNKLEILKRIHGEQDDANKENNGNTKIIDNDIEVKLHVGMSKQVDTCIFVYMYIYIYIYIYMFIACTLLICFIHTLCPLGTTY